MTGLESSSFLKIVVSLRRIYYYHLATTYLPSMCLLVVAEITLMIGDEYFDTTIMVSLTAMLVMYTLYQSVSGSLPQTAYLKSIDVWLIFGLIMPFLVFLYLVYVNLASNSKTLDILQVQSRTGAGNFTRNDNRVKQRKQAKISFKKVKTVIPLATLAFILIYWSYSLISYYYF